MQEETGVQLRGVANWKMLLGVVRELVQCTMEVGASTLGDAVRVNMTLGCGMGDATLGDVGRTLGVS